MTYPGNPSLSSDIRERILTTFSQALDLAGAGSRQEAILGCDFILRLDPQFEPARTLQRRLEAGDGPVETEDLRPPEAPPAAVATAVSDEETAPAEAPAAVEPTGAREPRSEVATESSSPAPPPPAPGPSADGLIQEMRRLVGAHDFPQAIALGEHNREAFASDPELRELLRKARSLEEADPYVRTFLDSARLALQEGKLEEAAGYLEKARALDPEHPGLADLEKAQGFYADPERRLGGRRNGLPLETIEEQAAPSGEPPASTPAPPPPGGSEDLDDVFGTGDDTASEARIRQLLDEGQGHFESGEYQSAIDAWSRIFLIDIDHVEASRRIDEARRLKAEGERQVEELYHEALGHLEGGRLDEARRGLERVLEMRPSHFAARDTLENLESGNLPRTPATEATIGEGEQADAEIAAETAEPLSAEETVAAEELQEEIFVPPEPGEAPSPDVAPPPPPPPPTATATAHTAPRLRRSFVYVGSLVLAIVLVAGWLLIANWDSVFPNSSPPPAPEVVRPTSLQRAKGLQDQGKTALALNILRRIPPTSDEYPEAQSLIAQWETAPEEEEPSEPEISPEDVARRVELAAAARRSLERGEYLAALESFQRAAAIAALDEEEEALSRRAYNELTPIRPQIELVRDGEWEFALRELWPLYQNDPSNRDVRRLIIDSYYNLGIRDLQRSKPGLAASRFEEALALDPDDEELQRLYLFAQTYEERTEDLLYRIFVKYLPFR